MLKPWDEDPAPVPRLAAVDPVASAAPEKPPLAESRNPSLASVRGPRLGDDLRAAAEPRDEWGIRAVSRRIGTSVAEALRLADRWRPIADPTADGAVPQAVGAGLTGDTVLALEVTSPGDALILDLRAWWIDSRGEEHPVAPRPVRGPQSGSRLWLPDLTAMTDGGGWPPGTYRLRVLVGPEAADLTVTIPGEPDPGLARRSQPPPTNEVLDRINAWIALGRNPGHLDGNPIITDEDLGGTDGDGTCGGSATITPQDELIGLVQGHRRRVTDVRAFSITSLARPELALRFASDPISGLTVVALPGGGLPARQYAFVVDTDGRGGPAGRAYTICIG